MDETKVNVLYDENGKAVRVQMDFELYEWLLKQVPPSRRNRRKEPAIAG